MYKKLISMLIATLLFVGVSSPVSAVENITDKCVVDFYGDINQNSTEDELLYEIKEIKHRRYNIGDNNYETRGKVISSYITENENGNFTTVNVVENITYIDVYSSNFSHLKSIQINNPLDLFGGYYSGEKYNFLIYGQSNLDESDECEVIRIQKYTKDWMFLDSVSLYGENTYIPFKSGSLRMTEVDQLLYVYTCHTMYADSNSTHHQSNMTFAIDTENTEIVYIFSGVLNYWQTSYVSHSFNQFIFADNENIYRVDHGDCYPRGIYISKTSIDGSVNKFDYAVPVIFEGKQGSNYTGASIGGAECSLNSILVAGNRNADSDDLHSNVRDIFVSVVSKDMEVQNYVNITEYDINDKLTAFTPHLIKINEEQFLLMWEECNLLNNSCITKTVVIDSTGNKISDIISVPYRLSNCLPILTSNNTIKWFSSDNNSSYLYTVNPNKLLETEEGVDNYEIGDVNNDTKINIKDVSMIQKHLAKLTTLNGPALKSADSNYDGKLSISDATKIQKYIAKIINTL